MRKTEKFRAAQIKEKKETLLGNHGFNIQIFGGPTGATRITDVVVPTIFAGYMNKEPLDLNSFVQSGIMERTTEFNMLAAGPGFTFTMPFWDELEGEYEQRTDTDTGLPSFNKITGKAEIAVKLFDKYSAGASQLSSELAGSNAIKAIREKFSNKIASLDQRRIFSLLKGVFDSTEMATNILDITTRPGVAKNFGVATIIEGQGLLGDRQQALTGTAMHSSTYTYLKLKNLITTQKQSDQGEEIPFYGTKRVIVDDSLVPTADGTYTTYLFAKGSIAYGRGGELDPVEVGKIPFMEEEGILVRKNHSFHVRGTTWKGAIDTICTPAELEKGTNWGKVYSHKQIPIVAIRHKVDLSEFTGAAKNGAEEMGKAIAAALKEALPVQQPIVQSQTEITESEGIENKPPKNSKGK